MADIIGSVSRNSSRFTYYLRCTEQDVSGGADNRSKVRVGIRIASSGSSLWASRYVSATHYIYINGVEYEAESGTYELRGGEDIEIASVVSGWIGHNSDGSKTVSISAESPDLAQGNGYGPYSGSASGSMTLTKIPRYATGVSLSLVSKTLNSITMRWTANETCSKVKYGLSSGSLTEHTVNAKTGTFTISNLEPNTTYTIYFNAKRSDSNLYLTSNVTSSQKTYNIATFTNYPTSFNIGSDVAITYTNPSNSPVKLKVYISSPIELIHESPYLTNGSYTWTNTSGLYAKTPNSDTLGMSFVLITEGNQNYTEFKEINALVTNSNPIFSDFDYEDVYDEDNGTKGTVRLTNDSSVLIKNYSKVQAIVTTDNKAIAQNSATMTGNDAGYKFIIGNQSPLTANWSSTETVYLNSLLATDNVLKLSARDSRGFLTEISKTLAIGTKFIEYEDLTITGVTAVRSAGGAGSEVTLAIDGTFWNHKFSDDSGAVTNHIKSITYEYKETSSNTWVTGDTPITATESNAHYSYVHAIRGDQGGDGFSISKAFNIRVTVQDELSTKQYTLTLGSGQPAIAINSDNKVAIGQKYDTTLGGALQVNGTIYQSGESLLNQANLKSTETISSTDTYNCNYINSIVESGSVANKGNYIKYADGSMIVTQSFQKTITSWNSWGTMYSGALGTSPDFPVAFTETPKISVTLTSSTANGWVATESQNTSTTKASNYQVVRPTTVAKATYTVNIIAIGKWK